MRHASQYHDCIAAVKRGDGIVKLPKGFASAGGFSRVAFGPEYIEYRETSSTAAAIVGAAASIMFAVSMVLIAKWFDWLHQPGILVMVAATLFLLTIALMCRSTYRHWIERATCVIRPQDQSVEIAWNRYDPAQRLSYRDIQFIKARANIIGGKGLPYRAHVLALVSSDILLILEWDPSEQGLLADVDKLKNTARIHIKNSDTLFVGSIGLL